MIYTKKWNFGLGTVFSLIVVYFIYLYSKDKNWTLLAFISKWYLIIVGSLILLSIGIILLIILFSLLMLLLATLKLKSFEKKHKRDRTRDYIDAEFKVKE